MAMTEVQLINNCWLHICLLSNGNNIQRGLYIDNVFYMNKLNDLTNENGNLHSLYIQNLDIDGSCLMYIVYLQFSFYQNYTDILKKSMNI